MYVYDLTKSYTMQPIETDPQAIIIAVFLPQLFDMMLMLRQEMMSAIPIKTPFVYKLPLS